MATRPENSRQVKEKRLPSAFLMVVWHGALFFAHSVFPYDFFFDKSARHGSVAWCHFLVASIFHAKY